MYSISWTDKIYTRNNTLRSICNTAQHPANKFYIMHVFQYCLWSNINEFTNDDT